MNTSENQTSKDYLSSGKLYELALFIYTLINNTTEAFDLGKEIKFGDKWDDLVVKQYKDGYDQYTFLQIKLINDSKNSDNFIDSKVLLGKRKISLKEDDYKLQKYLISYLRIKDQLKARENNFKIKNLIIFTNAELNINELNKNVGEVRIKLTSEYDIVPNTNKNYNDNKNITYQIAKIRNSFFREMKTNLKSDSAKLTEELLKYVMNRNSEIMTLDKDFLAYYHTSLISENIIDVTAQKQGKRIIKKGKFTQNFIDNQNLTFRAQNLRNILTDMAKSNISMTSHMLQENMKLAEWTVSDDFDENQIKNLIFLPNYDINDKDISEFFDILELRAKQHDIKEILSTIANVEIKKIFLEYYDTDPKLVEFLINDFVQSWQGETSTREKWILHKEKSSFIERLQIKISKPKVEHKTKERLKYLEKIRITLNLYYDDYYLFGSSNLKYSFVVIKTESIVLTSAKLIQSLNKMKRQDIIFINLDDLIDQKEIIKLADAFRSNDFSVMIISFSFVLQSKIFEDLFIQLSITTKKYSRKTVIFITSCEDFHINKLSCINSYKEYEDNLISLPYLRSAAKILEQEIIIQEQLMRFSDFIDESCNDYNLINAKIIEAIIDKKEIRIGSQPLRTPDLEGAYTDCLEDLNLETFVNKLLTETSNCLYIINGIPGSHKPSKFLKCLKTEILDPSLKSQIDDIKHLTGVINCECLNKPMNKKIQICDFVLKKQHFYQICYNNSEKKIFWISVKYSVPISKFTLEQIYNPDFYIAGQRFNDEIVIDKNIKTLFVSNKLCDSFVIYLKYEHEFESWLELMDNEYDQFKENCANKQITFIIYKDDLQSMLEDVDEHLEVIQSQTLHLLIFEKNNLIWYKTYGSLNSLSSFRAKNYNYTKPLLDENILIEKIKKRKVVVFAGDPGIGKSTALVKLTETKYKLNSVIEKSLQQSHWLIKINLKDHVHVLKNINLSVYDEEMIHQEMANFLSLVDDSLNNQIAKILLRVVMKKERCKKHLLILFDGFDEVLDNSDRQKIINLFQLIKNKTTAKFWVTTRLHFECALENAVSNFAIRIEKMNENQIREFIKNNLSNCVSLIFSDKELFNVLHVSESNKTTKINDYVYEFTSRIKKVFEGDISKFIGTPLQLYLMMADSARHFVSWIKNNKARIPSFDYFGDNIWTVYEKFINKKYQIYFKKSNVKEHIRQEQEQSIFDAYHRSLAKSLIFKSTPKKDFEHFKDMLLLVGIIRSHGDEVEFIHPTFREYFAAKEIFAWIMKWKKGVIKSLMNFHKQEYLLETILSKSNYRMVRSFLNVKLLEDKQEFVQLEEVYYDKDILFVATKENHVGIMNFMLRNFKRANVENYFVVPYLHDANYYFHKRVKLPLLHIAVELCNLDMIKYLVKNSADVNSKDNYGVSILHKICKFGDIDMVKFFVKHGANINVVDETNTSVLQSAVKYSGLETCKFLIENGANINNTNNDGESVIFNAIKSNNLELVKFLVERGVGLNMDNNDKKSVLYYAIDFSNFKMVEYLVVNGMDVKLRDSFNRSILHCTFEFSNFEVIRFLVLNGADVNAQDNYNKSVLHSAAERSSLNIYEFLVANGADIYVKDKNDKTVLHSAAESNKLDIVKSLVSNGVKINLKDKNKKTALHSAAKSGNLEMVQFLILKGADIYAKDGSDTSILHSAAESDNLNIVQLLIEKGLNVNEKNKYGTSILHIAAERKNVKMIKLLIKKGANITASQYDRKSVLHSATDCSRFHRYHFEMRGKSFKPYNNANEIVNILILNGADLNVKDFVGRSVLVIAAESYNWELVKLLLERGVLCNAKEKTSILHKATESGDIETVKFLTEFFSEISAKDYEEKSILHKATEFGNLTVVKYLVANGADINARDKNGKTVLHSKRLDFSLIQFLVQAGANILAKTAKNKSVLHYAVSNFNLKVVNFLITEGACINDRNNNGKSVLHKAVKFLPMVKYLVRKGANVNSVDKHSTSVLQEAAQFGDLDIVNFLMFYGADVNAKDNNNRTMLHYAAESGNEEMLKFLVAKGLDVNAKGKYKDSVLHHAIYSSNLSLVKYVIAAGADVNFKDNNKRTVLFDAVYCYNLDIVTHLINSGANINVVDKNCKSILHIAVKRCDLRIISVLVMNGANINAKDTNNISVLHEAVENGNIDVIKFLITRGADVNAKDKKNKSVLHVASDLHNHMNRFEIVQILIANGADVNVSNDQCISVLHYAVKYGIDVVHLLVMNNADVNAKDINGSSVLHTAVESQNPETIEYLIAKGADVNARDKNGKSILHGAVKNGSLDVVKSLLANGAYTFVKDDEGRSVLHSAAVEYVNFDVVRFLINVGLDPKSEDMNNETVLHYAVYSTNLDLVKYIIASGAEINKKEIHGISILCNAVLVCHFGIVNYLLEIGADVSVLDNNGKSVLHYACRPGDLYIFRLLVAHGADVNAKDDSDISVLHTAVRFGRTDVVEYLVALGADVNSKDNNNTSVLHYAVLSGDLNIVQLLITKGADINALDKSRKSVLHIAANYGDLNIVNYLLMNNVDINVTDSNKTTVLHSAVESEKLEIIELLVAQGLNVNAKDISDKSVLHFAIKSNSSKTVVQFLLANGADLNTKCKKGVTVLHKATESDALEIVELLVEHGSDVNASDETGRTILHAAVSLNNLKMVRFMVEEGADYNAKNNDGKSVLQCAEESANIDIILYLLEAGAIGGSDCQFWLTFRKRVLEKGLH